MSEQVAAILDVLAERFGTTAEHLWGVLVYQQYIDGVMATVWAVVFLLGILLSVKLGRLAAGGEHWLVSNDPESALLFSVVMGVVFFILLTMASHSMMSNFLNPEYDAIRMVFRAIK